MIYRPPEEHDFVSMQALDLELARFEVEHFDELTDRERETKTRTSLAALKFYERSEHSFVACPSDEISLSGTVFGFVFAQAVWMGDKPIVWVSYLRLHHDAPEGCLAGLLHAVTKSAYDAAVYEIHMHTTEREVLQVLNREGYKDAGQKHLVRHLGSQSQNKK